MKCKRISATRRQVCSGDLDALINIQTRSIDDDLDLNEVATFVTDFSPWAMRKTLRGVFVVDEVTGEDIEATDSFIIRTPDESVSGDNWVEFEGQRYRILSQENYDRRNQFLNLMCTDRGMNTREASNA